VRGSPLLHVSAEADCASQRAKAILSLHHISHEFGAAQPMIVRARQSASLCRPRVLPAQRSQALAVMWETPARADTKRVENDAS
jgi:hypothetical protein